MTIILESSVVQLGTKLAILLLAGWLGHAMLSKWNPRWQVWLWRVTAAGVAILFIAAAFPPMYDVPLLPTTTTNIDPTVNPAVDEEIRNPEKIPMEAPVKRLASQSFEVAKFTSAEIADAVPPVASPAQQSIDLPLSPDTKTNSKPMTVDVGWFSRKANWSMLGILIYALVVGWLHARLVIGLYLARREMSFAAPAPAWVEEIAGQVTRDSVGRTIPVRFSDRFESPVLCGVFQSVILLPSSMLSSALAERDIRGAIAHEASHAAGHDLFWDLFIAATTALAWPIPFAWRVRAVHRTSCERVSDRMAIDSLGDLAAYQSLVARIALRVSGSASDIGLAMARQSEVRRRLSLLTTCPCVPRLGLMAVVLSVCAMIAASTLGIGSLVTRSTRVNAATSEPRNTDDKTKDDKEEANPIEEPVRVRPTVKPDDQKRFQQYGYAMHEHPVTITGHTLSEDGQPVAGARVFVIPVPPSGSPYGKDLKILADATSDREGKYQFENVVLTALEFAPQAVPKPTEAHFQIFAVADGYGYVWRRSMSYRPGKRAGEAREQIADKPAANATADEGSGFVFYSDEPIVVDLDFSPEVRLHGTISDNHGNPLQGAIVRVGLITSGREMPTDAPNMWRGGYLEDSKRAADQSFQGFAFLPEKYRVGTTDVEGQYEIPGLPRDCDFLASIDYRPEYEPWVDSINTGSKALPNGLAFPFSGVLNRTLIAPVTVRVKLVDPNNKPISGVIVRQNSERHARRSGSTDRTDPDGIATLKLPPVNSTLIIEPNFDQPFLPKKLSVEITDPQHTQVIDLVSELQPAAEVVFETIEQETGVAIGGIAFLSELADVPERKPVQSQLSFVDHPQTKETGTLRAFFEPGQRRFIVDQKRSTTEFESIHPISEFINVVPGAPTKVRFEFIKRSKLRSEIESIPDEVKSFSEVLKRQRDRFERDSRLRFQLRHNNYIPGEMSREQMTTLLDSFASKTVDECIESIRREFPDFRGFGEIQLVMEGTKRRVDFRHANATRREVNVFNGEETLISMDAGRQLDIYDGKNLTSHFLDRSDFWTGPSHSQFLAQPKQQPGQGPPTRSFRREKGILEVETISEAITFYTETELETGFVRRTAATSRQDRRLGEETRQLFPTLLSDGVAVPKLSVKVYYQPQNKVRLAVTLIDQVELLDSLPPETFLVEAPAGTNVIDYRGIPREEVGSGRRAPSGVLRAAVPDVVAYRNQFAPALEPVLKIGQEAPKFNVSTWLNASGEIVAPEWKGKIIVIDFWGIGCGPCVGELPEVNEASQHFANSNIVIVGVHTSGTSAADLTTFIQKKGLVFPTAIDQPDANSHTFGTTFAAFGIDAIPSTAVIDTKGRVAYLGTFRQAIEIANKLLIE